MTYKLLLDHGAWRARTTPLGHVDPAAIAAPLADQKAFVQGVDAEGRALVIVRVRNHLSARSEHKPMRLFAAYILDTLVALCDPERNPARRVVALFDMGGASMANMDVATMRSILSLLSVHYVERLACLYFYDPPRIFHGLWNASRHLVPEVTRSKIKMVAAGDLDALRACVPADVLPEEFGGRAPLRPIDAAARHFGLPPHGAAAAAAARGSGDGGSADGGGDDASSSDGVDARLVVDAADAAAAGGGAKGAAAVAEAEAGREVEPARA